eukprot:1493473-Pyramimonas_sp.AAC.2
MSPKTQDFLYANASDSILRAGGNKIASLTELCGPAHGLSSNWSAGLYALARFIYQTMAMTRVRGGALITTSMKIW